MLNKEILRSYALIGAQARLAELDRERVDLLETFPELEVSAHRQHPRRRQFLSGE